MKDRCCLFAVSTVLCILALGMCHDPNPNPKSVVIVGKARFTLLTTHLIRMEWGGTNNNATFAFINRNTPTPPYNVTEDGDWIVIQTSAVKVRYLPSNETFNPDNLVVSIQLNGETVSWSPGPTANATLDGNLLGTIRSLDRINGSVELDCLLQTDPDFHCQLGLVSTMGYVVVDNTNHPHFDNSDWPWVVNQTFPQPSPSSCDKVEPTMRRDCGFPGIYEFDCVGKGCCYDNSSKDGIPQCFYTDTSYMDLYFWGHGHDYKLALKEFTMVAGKIPIPPRYAFGIYYSRYHAYNDVGEMEIVRGYEQRGIPLDVLVTDMDWHITFYKEAAEGKKDQAGERIGWSGFTWDSHLFPNPRGYLDWVERKGLKATLNVHPASGIQPWEEKYPEMAEAMGIDPKTNKYVPFVPSDKKFVSNWMKIVMGERESEGVDFWWLDWAQGEQWIKIPLVNPTYWLNYIFFTNPYHWNTTSPITRPLILHRWGGLGNHRYQVGFSGDVIPSWASLDFQVFFTLAATNVAFGYWSHDIGGHTEPVAAELYTRWVQWGIFSPLFRPHCGKSGDDVRRIWVYPPENYEIMRQAMLVREALVPYIYSYARFAYDEGLSLLRPMYYEYPEMNEAYTYKNQYFFGPDILVAPVTHSVDNITEMATKMIWIPEGSYISWFSGEMVTGPQTINRTFTLSEIPVYVRAGTIVPMRTDDFAPLGSAKVIPSMLRFMVFIGNMKSGSLYLYEDDGNTTEYMSGKFANTTVQYTWDSDHNTLSVTVGPTSGSFTGLPSARSYQICIPNFSPADKVTLEGKEVPYVPLEDSFATYSKDSWTYDGSTLSLIINIISKLPVSGKVTVTASYTSFKDFIPYWFPGFTGRLMRLQQAKQTLDDQWSIDKVFQEDYDGLLLATETGVRVTYDPVNIFNLTVHFEAYVQAAIDELNVLPRLYQDIKTRLIAQISSL